MVWMALLSAP
uniref:Uncharacterized protein n=1 Tax=Arundo donax TaxID=35708 RepID=A0A0A8YVX8_ARUDO